MDDAAPFIQSLPSCVLHSILTRLGPQDLCRVSVTCKYWHAITSKDAATNRVWRGFYASRWQVPRQAAVAAAGTAGVRWQRLYADKMLTTRCWSGKYHQDNLFGHKLGVRCVKLLPSHNVLVTGSMDKTVRLWDLSAGMPVSVSRPHGGIVRSLAVDSLALYSGSSDNCIRVWHATPPSAVGDAGSSGGEDASARAGPLFNLTCTPEVVRGHRGPVSVLALTDRTLYSGSWDYTLRAWSRSSRADRGDGDGGSLELEAVFNYDDWVTGVAVRGPNLLVSAGPQVVVQDLKTGQVVRKFTGLHEGHVTCLEGTHNGRMLFTGSVDGLVLGHDLRMRNPTVVLWHHNAAVQGMCLEDPWLVSASSDGTVMLLNTETQLRVTTRGLSNNCRQLAAPGGSAHCIDLTEQWLACGAEAETVRVWDFSRAAEAAARAAAARAGRGSRARTRRAVAAQLQQQQQQHALVGPFPVAAAARSHAEEEKEEEVAQDADLEQPLPAPPQGKGCGRRRRGGGSSACRDGGGSSSSSRALTGNNAVELSGHEVEASGRSSQQQQQHVLAGGGGAAGGSTAVSEDGSQASHRGGGGSQHGGGGSGGSSYHRMQAVGGGKGGTSGRRGRSGRTYAPPPPPPPTPRATALHAQGVAQLGAGGTLRGGGGGAAAVPGAGGQGGYWCASRRRSSAADGGHAAKGGRA